MRCDQSSLCRKSIATPIVELIIALLSLGKQGYLHEIQNQKDNRILLESQLQQIAENLGEEIIASHNPVSCAITLSTFSDEQIDQLGGYLYNLRVTGHRIINSKVNSFGSCTDIPLPPYIVMNAAIGSSQFDITESISRLSQAFDQIKTK